jgi:nucleoside-diphosphate-sugar epimerase
MNILLTGILSPMVWGMVERFERNAHHVTILGRVDGSEPEHTSAVFHDMHPSNPDAQKLLQAGRFQVIVFFYAYQCEEMQEYGSVQGSMLDVLFSFQQTASQSGVERFILVTDQRVFGPSQGAGENETPIPDSPTGILIKAAEDCLRYSKADRMKTLIVRVTNLYMQGTEDAFFCRAIHHARNNKPMVIDGTEDSPCDFLHVDDLALLLGLSLETELSGVVHLAYGDLCTYGKVIEAIRKHVPGLTAAYTGRYPRNRMLKTSQAAKDLDWVPRHHWLQELDDIIAGDLKHNSKMKPFKLLKDIGRRLFGKALPGVELIVLGGLAQWLSSLAKTFATFRFADFWLFYVILMGSMHGGLVGIVAAIIACFSYGIDWVIKGNDLYLLLYNMDNWLPLMMYMLAGGLFGYMHDKTGEKVKMLEREKEERDTETAFLESMYKQASEDRSQLQKQVMRYRDSYGRIYSITQELDTLQPEQVFLSTLNVLEDTMQNHSVALYSRTGNTPFARLVVHSREIVGSLSKSLDLDKFPLMKARLERGEMFTNTALEPGYPVFCAPLMQDERLIAMIALWDVPFDQQTLYHQNLFNVVAGLTQSAMVRTLRYFNMSQDMYLEGTHILADKAFRSAMGVYQRMRKQRTSSYLLLRVKSLSGEADLREMDRCIGSVTRTTDVTGRTDDGAYFVLLPQASVENMPQIENRFYKAGLTCEVMAQEVAYA